MVEPDVTVVQVAINSSSWKYATDFALCVYLFNLIICIRLIEIENSEIILNYVVCKYKCVWFITQTIIYKCLFISHLPDTKNIRIDYRNLSIRSLSLVEINEELRFVRKKQGQNENVCKSDGQWFLYRAGQSLNKVKRCAGTKEPIFSIAWIRFNYYCVLFYRGLFTHEVN